MIEFPFPPRNVDASTQDWMSKLKDALDERFKTGEGSPEGVVTANPGCIYQRTDGGAHLVLVGEAAVVGVVPLEHHVDQAAREEHGERAEEVLGREQLEPRLHERLGVDLVAGLDDFRLAQHLPEVHPLRRQRHGGTA